MVVSDGRVQPKRPAAVCFPECMGLQCPAGVSWWFFSRGCWVSCRTAGDSVPGPSLGLRERPRDRGGWDMNLGQHLGVSAIPMTGMAQCFRAFAAQRARR